MSKRDIYGVEEVIVNDMLMYRVDGCIFLSRGEALRYTANNKRMNTEAVTYGYRGYLDYDPVRIAREGKLLHGIKL